MANWMHSVKSPLKLHLDRVIKNSADYKNSIRLAKDKRTAQLWLSNALLSKELHESKVRIKYLENLVVDLLEEKKRQTKSTKKKKGINKLIRTLKKF